MTSVERVQQYYRLPPEALDEVEEKKPNSDWPGNGALRFENVSFSYYEDGPIVLKNVSFHINGKEKVKMYYGNTRKLKQKHHIINPSLNVIASYFN